MVGRSQVSPTSMAEADHRCFVISPIGEPASDTRNRADKVLRHIIGPVVEAAGFLAIRADKISDPGVITAQIIQHLLDDALVIADLTGRNPNVYYELAARHATGKATIHIVDYKEDIPFDVAPIRAIKFDYCDLDSVEQCKQELSKQIEHLKRVKRTETPLSQAVNLHDLQNSNAPVEQALADLTLNMSRIQQQIDRLVSSNLSSLVSIPNPYPSGFSTKFTPITFTPSMFSPLNTDTFGLGPTDTYPLRSPVWQNINDSNGPSDVPPVTGLDEE